MYKQRLIKIIAVSIVWTLMLFGSITWVVASPSTAITTPSGYTVDLNYLLQNQFSKEEITALDYYAPVIEMLLKTGQIDKEHAHVLAKGLLETRPNKAETLKDGPPPFPAPSSRHTVDSSSTCTGVGAHWILKSTSGYNQVTGRATLPTNIHVTYLNGQQNDVPYMFFGAYARGGADIGLYYNDLQKKWKLFIYTLAGRWHEGDALISSSTTPTVYLIMTVLDDALEISAIDNATWTPIETKRWSEPGQGWNASGSGVYITNEHSLAQHVGNLSNGAYMRTSHWWDLYLYKTSGYGLWTPSRTLSGYPYIEPLCAETTGKVKMTINNRWYNTKADIYFSP
ncbi:MAG: hypothetical protein ACPL5F_11750 [Moorellaceae bacterium]